ncbi:hypothetical protein AMTRI_Chr11g155570 [Amborella trichopoda]
MEEVQALQNASENQEDVEPLVTVNAYFVEPLVVIPQLVQPFLFLPDTAIVTHQVMEGSTVGVIIAEDFILENPKADVDEDKAQDLKVETMFGDMGANFEVSSGVVLEEIIARKMAEKIKDGKAVTKGFNNVEKTLEKKSKKKSKGKGTIKPSRYSANISSKFSAAADAGLSSKGVLLFESDVVELSNNLSSLKSFVRFRCYGRSIAA